MQVYVTNLLRVDGQYGMDFAIFYYGFICLLALASFIFLINHLIRIYAFKDKSYRYKWASPICIGLALLMVLIANLIGVP